MSGAGAKNVSWHEFASPVVLAERLAHAVSDALRGAIGTKGEAILVVSGGTTPVRFFQALSRAQIDWRNVTITLVDERCVPAGSPRSNAQMVVRTLLQNEAANARFERLYEPADTAKAAAQTANDRLAGIQPLFDAVVLGMGIDGHTASFFPDAEELTALLDPAAPTGVRAVHAPSAGEDRLTWPLSALVSAPYVAVHIEGVEKKVVLLGALEQGSTSLPISAVIDHSQTPVQIFWAPAERKEP